MVFTGSHEESTHPRTLEHLHAMILGEQERKARLLTLWLSDYDDVVTGAIVGRGLRGDDVEDVKQVVGVKAWKGLMDGEELPKSPRNWLWRIADRSALDLRLKERRRKKLVSIEPCDELDQIKRQDTVEPWEEAAQAETDRVASEFVASLDLLTTMILERRFVERCSFIEIEAELGIPYWRVRRLYQLALRLLKAKLEGHD
jgi:RNA polymerase sigma factor (sigma-70 family)